MVPQISGDDVGGSPLRRWAFPQLFVRPTAFSMSNTAGQKAVLSAFVIGCTKSEYISRDSKCDGGETQQVQSPMDCSSCFQLSAPMMSAVAVSDQLEDGYGYSTVCFVPSQLPCPPRAPHRLRLWGSGT